jgi:hypothetical protein
MPTVRAGGNVVIVKGRHEVCGTCRSDYESNSEVVDHKPNKSILLKNEQVQKGKLLYVYDTVGALKLY